MRVKQTIYRYAGERVFNPYNAPYETDYNVTSLNPNYANNLDRLRDIVNKINDAKYVVLPRSKAGGIIRMLCVEIEKEVKYV